MAPRTAAPRRRAHRAAPRPFVSTPAIADAPSPTDSVAFLVEAASALAASGLAAHDVEDAMTRCARRLRINAACNVTPVSVLVAAGEGDDQRAHLVPIRAAGSNLARLCDLDRALAGVLAGALHPRAALRAVRDASSAPPVHGLAVSSLGAGALAASAGAFFGGSIPDVVAAGALGMGVALLTALLAAHDRLGRLTDFIAGFAAAFAAAHLARAFPPLHPQIVTLAGVVALLPGLALTIAVSEIASRSLVAGASRLLGALAGLFTLVFGVALGLRAAGAPLAIAPTGAFDQPEWLPAVALALACASLHIVFQAKRRHALLIAGAGALGFLTARAATANFGPELGAFTGAGAVAVASNLATRILDRPAVLTLLPGMLLLVPGSLGFRSIAGIVGPDAADAISGVQGVVTMGIVAVALVTGLLVANVIIPPRAWK
jgi:uncharacterized membrane protein YjjP (DUF1212 family)